MTVLAALVLGSMLMAAGGTETASTEQIDSAEQAEAAPAPDPKAARRAEKIARRRRTMLKLHTIGGVALEVASTGLHALTAVGFIDADANLPPEGCAAPDMPCKGGTPVVLFVPMGAMATGWIGATRIAAAREASFLRSPLFWFGTAVSLASWVVPALVVDGGDTRRDRLTIDVVLVAGLVSGTAVQMWGAFLAPPREVKVASSSLHLAPGCGPTSGGVACGLTLAGF